MPKISSEAEFKQLVLDHLESFPPQQQSIAEYLLDHLSEAPFISVPELAQRTGASEATVVRFAKRMGYDGFSGLKMDLMEALKEQVAQKKNFSDLLQEPLGNDTLAAACHQEIYNIEQTRHNITKEVFQKTATALFKADHVFTFGLGVSAHLAEILSYLLVQIGLRASTLTPKSSSPLEQLVPLRLTDMLVVFSLPPYSRATVEMIREVKSRGIPSLAICDKLTAPVAKDATHVLTVRTDNMMFTNSLAAMSVLLNALVTEIAVRHGDQAVEAVSRINQILSADQNLIGDEG